MAEIEIAPKRGTVLCDQRCADCRCHEASGHDEPHRCPCGGAWTGVEGTDSWEVVDFPSYPGLGLAGLFMPLPFALRGLGFDEDW